MLPPQRKEEESILEQKERARRPEILNNNFMWKSPPQLIKQHQSKGSDGTLLDDLQKSVFDGERQKQLKWRQTSSPEITEMQRRTQDLPNHKVYVLVFLSFTNCPRFCLIVSWIETPWLQGTCSFNQWEKSNVNTRLGLNRALRFISDLKAQLLATITSVCPSCKTRYFPNLPNHNFEILVQWGDAVGWEASDVVHIDMGKCQWRQW